MNYWLHRISHHAEVSYPLIKKRILSVGWSDFSNEEYLDECSGDWDKLEKHYKDKEPILGVNNWEIVLSNVMIDSGMYF